MFLLFGVARETLPRFLKNRKLCRDLRKQTSECWQLQSQCEACQGTLLTGEAPAPSQLVFTPSLHTSNRASSCPSRVPQCPRSAHGAGRGVPAARCVQRAVRRDLVYCPAPHWWNRQLAEQHGGWIQLGGPSREQQQRPWEHLPHHKGETQWRIRMKRGSDAD